jgi:hypothetical protein
MTKYLKKFTAEKKFDIFFEKKLQFSYPQASIKDAQAAEEAFSPQKRTSSTTKHEYSLLCSIHVARFCTPGSGAGSSNSY